MFEPPYVRLSGEIADQTMLDDLREGFPGVDRSRLCLDRSRRRLCRERGLEGFPASIVGDDRPRRRDESRRRYVAATLAAHRGRLSRRSAPALRDSEGFVDTGDIVELRGDRYYFVGRRGGIINVGGLKVHPEEVEAVINRHHAVHMSRVKSRKNPFTGSIIIADVVLKAADRTGGDSGCARKS